MTGTPGLAERVSTGDVDGVRSALAAGADPDAVDPDSGQTPLLLATSADLPAIVAALLAGGARVDLAVDGVRPLVEASHGRTEVLRLLLEAGAAAGPLPGEDHAPIYLAASDPEAIALLLAHGADPNVTTPLDETPLSFAVSWSLLPSVERLLAGGADPDKVMAELDWSILMFAAQEGDEAVITALLAAGADPAYVNPRGQTARSVALDHGHPAAAALLG